MSITVEFSPTKEKIFKKSDEECDQLAEKLRKTGEVYIDPDFPPKQTSIGVLIDSSTGEAKVQKSEEPWLEPKKFIRPVFLRDIFDEWGVWDDPHPFHVAQEGLGNCGLIAALMAIAHRKELIEQIIPKRDYTMDCGIVPVRLFVNGEWKVIKIDFHIPQEDGLERFSKMTKKQCWVPFIEKAFAKIKGSYGQLHSICPMEAFTFLTGHPSKLNIINSETDSDALWENLIKHNSSGFLLAAATPKHVEGSEEKKQYEEININTLHAYAILGFKEHDGHRLLRLGHGGFTRFTGKWSHLHAYDNEFLKDLCPLDQIMSNIRIFWMEINDFRRLFACYYVNEYREGSVLKFKETYRRKKGDDVQYVNYTEMHIPHFRMPGFSVSKFIGINNLFLNIHECSEDNQCGELLHSFNALDDRIESDKVSFTPGVYLLVFVIFDNNLCVENEWTIWSSTSLDKSQIQFISCPFSVHYRSVTEVILEYGEAEEEIKEDQIVVYEWCGKYNCFYMVDNLRKSEYVYVKCEITSGNEQELRTNLSSLQAYFHPVPPMSRSIVGIVMCLKYKPITVAVDVQYAISSFFFNWINQLDAWFTRDELENFIPLDSEN